MVVVKKVIKALEMDGWLLVSQKGSHMKFKKNDKICIVPNHKGDIPKGTQESKFDFCTNYYHYEKKVKRKYFYPAIFSKEGTAYNVKFIDFENIFTFGEGIEDAYYMAQDALYNMLPEYKDNLPEPTMEYMNIPVGEDEFITMVELDPVEHERKISSKTVKTTVTMPEWLKNLADMKGLNFSKILQEGLKNELNLL